MNSPKRILIVGPSWIGDMVMAQSLFMALKKQHPDCLVKISPEQILGLFQT